MTKGTIKRFLLLVGGGGGKGRGHTPVSGLQETSKPVKLRSENDKGRGGGGGGGGKKTDLKNARLQL